MLRTIAHDVAQCYRLIKDPANLFPVRSARWDDLRGVETRYDELVLASSPDPAYGLILVAQGFLPRYAKFIRNDWARLVGVAAPIAVPEAFRLTETFVEDAAGVFVAFDGVAVDADVLAA